MSSPSSPEEKIATSSVEEGLDFACSLISDAISKQGRAKPEKALQLLEELSSYVQLRYVGELGLALEYLAELGSLCSPDLFQSRQFWSQLRWLAEKIELTPEKIAKLGFPNEERA
jgi:hypothetical protein